MPRSFSATPDTAFRWDPTGQQWIFNQATKNNSSLTTKGVTYYFTINLNDGSSIYFQNTGPTVYDPKDTRTIFPSLMGFIMGNRYTHPIRNVRKPAIRKMSPMLKRYNAAWSASISHCPLPETFQIGPAGWNVEGIPTDGITPLFKDVTKALQVIPSKIKSPPFTLARTM